jgi:hypothetical protein
MVTRMWPLMWFLQVFHVSKYINKGEQVTLHVTSVLFINKGELVTLHVTSVLFINKGEQVTLHVTSVLFALNPLY